MAKLMECQRCHGKYEGHGNSRYCENCQYQAHLEASREVYHRNKKKKIESMEPRKCWDCGRILKTIDRRVIRCDQCQYQHEKKSYAKRMENLSHVRCLLKLLEVSPDALIQRVRELQGVLDKDTLDAVLLSFSSSRAVKIVVSSLEDKEQKKVTDLYREMGILD